MRTVTAGGGSQERKCLFFTGRFMMTCRARVNVYVPSSFEMREYCKTGRHKVCPFYSRARSLEQRQLFSAGSKSAFLSGR